MTVASLLLLFPTHDTIAKHVNNTSVAIVASAPPSNNIDVPLNGYINGYGSDDNGAVVVAAAVTLVGGFFMKGENIYYDKNQLIEVAVRDDTDINATPETLLTVMDPTVPQGQGLVVKPR